MTLKKRDEVHVKQISWKSRIVVCVAFLIAILLLIYLTAYSFTNLHIVITIVLIVVLIIVAGIAIFSIDVVFHRELE